MMMTEAAARLLLFVLLVGAGSASVVAEEKTESPAAEQGATQVQGATLGRMGEPAVVDADEFEFSDAERSLWMADHLQNIKGPARLYYEFRKSGTFEAGFTDSVYLDVIKINEDGTRDTDMQFFTGDRSQPFTPENTKEVRGNPVLGLYLRGDIHDMNRLTSGSWRHFQRRIKLALAEATSVEDLTVEFNGKSVPARRFVITPYLNDPHRGQFQQFSGKRYEFVLSDEIPGTIYEIRTVIPDAEGKTEPLIEERLTLKQIEVRG